MQQIKIYFYFAFQKSEEMESGQKYVKGLHGKRRLFMEQSHARAEHSEFVKRFVYDKHVSRTNESTKYRFVRAANDRVVR